LWGEAAHYHSQSESIVLDEALWGLAGIEQEARRVPDPWENVLRKPPRMVKFSEYKDGFQREREVQLIYEIDGEEVVAAADLLEHLLELAPGHQTTAHAMRLSTVMRHVGWSRPKNGYVTIGQERVKGYFRAASKAALVPRRATWST
jgi:hypothetical protein